VLLGTQSGVEPDLLLTIGGRYGVEVKYAAPHG